jgi:anti-sigma B factor antagonist
VIGINIETVQQVTIIKLDGEIDANVAPEVQKRVLLLAGPGCKILMDMTKLAYMSSAGLRMLLSVYRQISGNQGRVALTRLSDELKDTMSMTGFLGFFAVYDSIESGLQAFGQ